MDRTESTVRNVLNAIEAPLYDIGVLSSRGMLPGLDAIPASAVLERLSLLKYRIARGSHIYLRPSGEHRYTVLDDLTETALAKLSGDGFEPCAVVETSKDNFQAWLKQAAVVPKLLGTFAAQTVAARYSADPNVIDLHEAREREREQRRAERAFSPQRGPRFKPLLERFRTSAKYSDRPAAADIAFCLAALANGMDETRIECALEGDYLSRNRSLAKESAYIRRTMSNARDLVIR